MALLAGRFRLATSPNFIGSSTLEKTMGIVKVAALAAKAGGGPPLATITASLTPGQLGSPGPGSTIVLGHSAQR